MSNSLNAMGATSSMFLKVEGVSGESKVSNYEDWISVSGFSWGVNQPCSANTNSGCGAGAAQFQPLQIYAPIDKSTTALAKHCAKGSHLNKIEFVVAKAGGEQTEYAKITLEQVVVTEAQCSGDHRDLMVGIRYTFQGKKVKVQYWEQNADGGKGAESSFAWNIETQKEI